MIAPLPLVRGPKIRYFAVFSRKSRGGTTLPGTKAISLIRGARMMACGLLFYEGNPFGAPGLCDPTMRENRPSEPNS